jgi:hypothetical protein
LDCAGRDGVAAEPQSEGEMKKPRIYLDTSAIHFLFAADAPEKRDATATFSNMEPLKNKR